MRRKKRRVGRSVWLGLFALLVAGLIAIGGPGPDKIYAAGVIATGGETYLVDFDGGSLSSGIYQDGAGTNSWKFSGDLGGVSLTGGQLQLGPASSSTIGVFDYGFVGEPDSRYGNFEVSFDVTLINASQGGNVGLQFQKTFWSNGWATHPKVYFDTSAHMAFLNGTARLTDRHAISAYGGPAIATNTFPWPTYRLKAIVQGQSVKAYVDGADMPIIEYDELNALTGNGNPGFIGLFTFPGITTKIDNFLFHTIEEEDSRMPFGLAASGDELHVTLPSTPAGLSGYTVRYRNMTDAATESVYRYKGPGGVDIAVPVEQDKVYKVELYPTYTSGRTGVDTELTVYPVQYATVGTPPAILTADAPFSFFGASAEISLSVIGADTIRYTLDGSEPSVANGHELSGDTAFGGGFTVSETTTLKAAAYLGGVKTAELQRVYTALPNAVEIAEPFPYHEGYFHESYDIELSSPHAAELIYTLDGSDPAYDPVNGLALNGTTVAGGAVAIPLPQASATIKALAIRSGQASGIASRSFTYLASGIQAELYVDPVNGTDTNDGTFAAPFKTLAAARDAVRSINSVMTGDIVVYLREGTYRLDETLHLGVADSGSRSFKVDYRAYPGESPVVSGGTIIAGWSLHDAPSGIYRAPVGSLDTRQLYVNGERAIRARSEHGLPNATVSSTGHSTAMTEIAGWGNPDDIELVYKERWTTPRFSVDSIQLVGSAAEIVMDQPGWSYGLDKGSTAPTLPWFIENAYELLDKPGEWYLDKSDGYIYYMPRVGENMATAVAVVPVLTELLVIAGDSVDEIVHDVAFRGIEFAEAGWLRPSTDVGHPDIQANYIREPALPGHAHKHELIPDAAVAVRAGHLIEFERNVFTRMGSTGLNVLQGSQNMTIRGNEFHDISGSAIQIGEVDMNVLDNRNPSDPKHLLQNIAVDNNYIHHIGVEYMSGVGVSAAYPDGLRIVNNEFWQLPYSAIHIGWGWEIFERNATRNNVIAYNYIHEVMQVLHDGGAIYTVGRSFGPGSESFIHDNYISHVKHYHGAIYLDQGSSDWRVNDNVVRLSQKLFVTNGGNLNVSGSGNYSDSRGIGAPASLLAGTTYVTGADWPQVALDIMVASGVTAAYADILPSVRPPEPAEGAALLDEDFESYTTGGNALDWDKVQTGGKVSVASSGLTQALALDTDGSGAGAVVAYHIFRNASGTLTIEAKLKTSSVAGFRIAPYMLNARAEPVITLGIMNGYLVNNKGSVQDALAPLSADTWYHVRIVANTNTDKFDVYLDNVLVADQASFRTASDEIEQIRFGSDVGVAGRFLVDDVRIDLENG
jgi:hypothetical protein